MGSAKRLVYYSPLEERINVISHGFGLVLSIFALVLLIIKSSLLGNVWQLVGFSIFGVSLIQLYAASTFYHNAKDELLRKRLNVFWS